MSGPCTRSRLGGIHLQQITQHTDPFPAGTDMEQDWNGLRTVSAQAISVEPIPCSEPFRNDSRTIPRRSLRQDNGRPDRNERDRTSECRFLLFKSGYLSFRQLAWFGQSPPLVVNARKRFEIFPRPFRNGVMGICLEPFRKSARQNHSISLRLVF